MGVSSEKAAVIQLRVPLKPIYTGGATAVEDERERENEATTPTFEGSRISSKLPCPPPPRKPRPAPNNRYNSKFCNAKREFFVTPLDLEAVFIRRHVGR